MPKQKSYKGYEIEIHTQGQNLVFARAPSISRQYLGSGKNKTEAFKDAQKAIDHIISVRKK